MTTTSLKLYMYLFVTSGYWKLAEEVVCAFISWGVKVIASSRAWRNPMKGNRSERRLGDMAEDENSQMVMKVVRDGRKKERKK
jgi:hypothetical protein